MVLKPKNGFEAASVAFCLRSVAGSAACGFAPTEFPNRRTGAADAPAGAREGAGVATFSSGTVGSEVDGSEGFPNKPPKFGAEELGFKPNLGRAEAPGAAEVETAPKDATDELNGIVALTPESLSFVDTSFFKPKPKDGPENKHTL